LIGSPPPPLLLSLWAEAVLAPALELPPSASSSEPQAASANGAVDNSSAKAIVRRGEKRRVSTGPPVVSWGELREVMRAGPVRSHRKSCIM
jgi:hypothetical protein